MMERLSKERIVHPEFHLVRFVKDPALPYLIFVHGGPGYNGGMLEYLIEQYDLFTTLTCNLILYDQRGCGRSIVWKETPTQLANVNDLAQIYRHLTQQSGLKINGLIGHSYGAKLLFDFYQSFQIKLPGIFIATAASIIIPRINNLIMDLNYLKTSDPARYSSVLAKLDGLDVARIAELTVEFEALFAENKSRTLFYWANLLWYERARAAQSVIALPVNQQVFTAIRRDLYASAANFSVAIPELAIPYLWLNGYHDFIMNGHETLLNKVNVTTFSQAAHYPHLEEHERFCNLVNQFMAANS